MSGKIQLFSWIDRTISAIWDAIMNPFLMKGAMYLSRKIKGPKAVRFGLIFLIWFVVWYVVLILSVFVPFTFIGAALLTAIEIFSVDANPVAKFVANLKEVVEIIGSAIVVVFLLGAFVLSVVYTSISSLKKDE